MENKRFTTPEILEIFDKLTTDCKNIMKVKNSDYTGTKGDQPFANFERCEYLGLCNTKIGMLVRMSDKFCRLITYCKSGKLMVPGEGYEDAVKDMINYLVLFYAFLLEEQTLQVLKNEPEETPVQTPAEQVKSTALDVGEDIDVATTIKYMKILNAAVSRNRQEKEETGLVVPMHLSEDVKEKLRAQGFSDEDIQKYARSGRKVLDKIVSLRGVCDEILNPFSMREDNQSE